MTKEKHPNWLYPAAVGKYITLAELLVRWDASKKFLWLIGTSGDLTPYREGRIGCFLPDEDGRTRLYFFPTFDEEHEDHIVVAEFPGDAQPVNEIPNDAAYYLPHVLAYEARNQAVLRGGGLDRIDSSEPSVPPKELGVRERDTLLKIIAALMVDGYGWDGTEPYSKAKEIANDVATKGIDLSDRTLGEKLKDAAGMLPPRARKK